MNSSTSNESHQSETRKAPKAGGDFNDFCKMLWLKLSRQVLQPIQTVGAHEHQVLLNAAGASLARRGALDEVGEPGRSLWVPFSKALGLIGMVVLAMPLGAKAENTRPTELRLDFEATASGPAWVAQNDDVMGGISKGEAEIKDGVLHFTGTLSLDNDGGFAQVEIRNLDHDLSGKKGVKLRVRGDGRTYQLRLATNALFRGSRIAYWAEFPTRAGEWTEVNVRFTDFKPSFRGDILDGPPLDVSRVEEMGFLISDKRTEPFALEVDWIRAE